MGVDGGWAETPPPKHSGFSRRESPSPSRLLGGRTIRTTRGEKIATAKKNCWRIAWVDALTNDADAVCKGKTMRRSTCREFAMAVAWIGGYRQELRIGASRGRGTGLVEVSIWILGNGVCSVRDSRHGTLGVSFSYCIKYHTTTAN